MSETIRVRFAPSPTGQVHIGNIRVAIFNWLFARGSGGAFLLRVEDTDRERSTPEAVAALMDAMAWLGLDHDEEIVYQSSQAPHHEAAADRLLNLDLAYRNSDALPATVFRIDKALYDPSFVTEPGDEAAIDTTKTFALRATLRNVVLVDRNEEKQQEFFRPIPWDAVEAGLVFHLADGGTMDGAELRAKAAEKLDPDLSAEDSLDLHDLAGGRVERFTFRRRHVFFDDLILGRRQKALDDLRDFVIVRGDDSPVFHLANVIDDASMKVTHILRGNDHLENSFRHLFLFKAIGEEPPRYGHFPMIVNAKKRPYSKRDGDAYVGDFRKQGYLPEALFNFLALCGWSPGDDRELFAPAECVEAFSLERVSDSPSEFNQEKLDWMNGQYLKEMPGERLVALLQEEAAAAGAATEEHDEAWWARLADVYRERLRVCAEFMAKAHFFFGQTVQVDWEQKKVRKALKKEGVAATLQKLRDSLATLEDWSEAALEQQVEAFVEAEGLKLGQVAQPLRIAVTGGVASPGIQETLFLIGRERTLKRLDDFGVAFAARTAEG